MPGGELPLEMGFERCERCSLQDIQSTSLGRDCSYVTLGATPTAPAVQGMYQDAKENFEAVLERLPDHSSAFNRLVCTFMTTATANQAELLRTCFLDLLYVKGVDEGDDDAEDSTHVGDDGLQVRCYTGQPCMVVTLATIVTDTYCCGCLPVYVACNHRDGCCGYYVDVCFEFVGDRSA